MEWISVKERLPEDRTIALVSYVYRGQRQRTIMAEYVPESRHKWYGDDREGQEVEGVTHWMPLPEPPK